MNTALSTARDLALRAHGDQMYGDQPYMVHVDAVVSTARYYGLGLDYETAAYLHDVLEDTALDADALRAAGIDPAAVDMVEAVTGRGANRKARNADAYRKLRALPAAIDLKLCDRLANGRAALHGAPGKLAMYRREYPAFRAELRPCGGAPALWAELDLLFAP